MQVIATGLKLAFTEITGNLKNLTSLILYLHRVENDENVRELINQLQNGLEAKKTQFRHSSESNDFFLLRKHKLWQ